MRSKSYLKCPGLLDLLEVDEGEGRRHHHQARDQQPEGHCPIEIDFETIIYILGVPILGTSCLYWATAVEADRTKYYLIKSAGEIRLRDPVTILDNDKILTCSSPNASASAAFP